MRLQTVDTTAVRQKFPRRRKETYIYLFSLIGGQIQTVCFVIKQRISRYIFFFVWRKSVESRYCYCVSKLNKSHKLFEVLHCRTRAERCESVRITTFYVVFFFVFLIIEILSEKEKSQTPTIFIDHWVSTHISFYIDLCPMISRHCYEVSLT